MMFKGRIEVVPSVKLLDNPLDLLASYNVPIGGSIIFLFEELNGEVESGVQLRLTDAYNFLFAVVGRETISGILREMHFKQS